MNNPPYTRFDNSSSKMSPKHLDRYVQEFAARNLSTTLRHRRLGFTEQAVGSQPRPAG